METLDEHRFKEWQKKRFRTYFYFCFQKFVAGLVYASYLNTSWLYVTVQLKAEKPYLVYSVLIYLHYLSTMLFGMIISHLHDRSKKTKMFIFVINLFCILGGIFYTIDASIYFPIAGSFLLGFRWLVQPIAVGDLTRSYPPEEYTQKLPVLKLCVHIAAGPAALILYFSENISFNIGFIHIGYGNFPGVIMVFLYTSLLILGILLVDNISLEYNLKESLQEKQVLTKNTGDIDSVIEDPLKFDKDFFVSDDESSNLLKADKIKPGKTTNETNSSLYQNLKRLFKNKDVLLLYYLVWLFNYLYYLSFAYIPLLIQAELQYNVQFANIAYLVFSAALVLFLPVLVFMKISSKTAYLAGLLSFILLIIIGLCFKLTDPVLGKAYNLTFVFMIVSLYGIVCTAEDIFLICTLARLVKADIQSFADGIRSVIMMVAATMGCLSVSLFAEFKDVFYVILLLALITAVILIILRRNSLIYSYAIV